MDQNDKDYEQTARYGYDERKYRVEYTEICLSASSGKSFSTALKYGRFMGHRSDGK